MPQHKVALDKNFVSSVNITSNSAETYNPVDVRSLVRVSRLEVIKAIHRSLETGDSIQTRQTVHRVNVLLSLRQAQFSPVQKRSA